MGAGFSRACVNDCTSSAVRPNVLCANKGKWILGVEGPEITAEGGDEAEVLPGSGECGEGERKMKRVIDPLLPSAAEISEHQLSHLPFRNWCPHCVKGRAKEMNHQKQPRVERGLDEFHIDYCFPGDNFGFKLTILVCVEKYTGMKCISVVPTKGATGAFAAQAY